MFRAGTQYSDVLRLGNHAEGKEGDERGQGGGTAIRYAQDARNVCAHIVTTKNKKKATTKERVGTAAQAL